MKFYRKKLRAKSEYLIHDARGRKMDYETWSKKFKQLMKYLGWTDMSVHGCRHTCATLLHTFGVDGTDARFILGHTQLDIHDRVYQHVQAQKLIQAIDMIKI
jgi:integrase